MLAIELTSLFVFLAIIVCNVSAYGDYVPQSVFLLNQLGQKTEEYHVRNKRDLEYVFDRLKRSPGNAQSDGSSHSYAGSYSHSGTGDSYIPNLEHLAANIPSSLDDIKKQAEEFANIHSRGSFNEDNLGYKGPILFSRSGVDKGTGVKVSGAAQGPNGAFSSSSSSVDDQGNIKYDVKSGKY